MRGCDVEGCQDRHYGRGWCRNHYERWYRTGRTPVPDEGPRECKVDGCVLMVSARGWCNYHYKRWYRLRRDPSDRMPPRRLRQVEVSRRRCEVADCEGWHVARGMCNKHYRRLMRGTDVHAETPEPKTGCKVRGCEGSHKARGFCMTHYNRWRRGAPVGGPIEVTPECEGCGGEPLGGGRWCLGCFQSRADQRPPASWDRRCGSYRGYDRHMRRGERPCEPCKAANREKVRARRAA